MMKKWGWSGSDVECTASTGTCSTLASVAMEEGGEKAGCVKPSPVSPSQTEAKSPVQIKTEPTEEGWEEGSGSWKRCDDTPKPSSVSNHETGDLSSSSEQERNSGDASHSSAEQEEPEFGKGVVVMRGEDFVVEVDPNYESEDDEVDVKEECESENEDLEVCFDSSAAMAGASSSDRQTGQSLCPASACLASSGEEAAADGRGRVGGNGVGPGNISGGVYSHPAPGLPVVFLTQTAVSQGSEGTVFCPQPQYAFHLGNHHGNGYREREGVNSCIAKKRSVADHSVLRGHLEREPQSVQGATKKLGSELNPEKSLSVPPQEVGDCACPECGKEFVEKYNRNMHLATVHRGEKNFSCKECGKKFGRSSALNVHLATVHRGERKFSCLECGKAFGQSGSLNMHMATVHRREKKFSCMECDKKFSKNWDLKNHLATVHKGLKKFACPECGKRFSEKGNLKVHAATVHRGEKKFSCPECGKAFGLSISLNRHLASMHKERSSLPSLARGTEETVG